MNYGMKSSSKKGWVDEYGVVITENVKKIKFLRVNLEKFLNYQKIII